MKRNLSGFLGIALAVLITLTGCQNPDQSDQILIGPAAPVFTGNDVEPAGEYDSIIVKYKDGVAPSRALGGEKLSIGTGNYSVISVSELSSTRGFTSVSAHLSYLNSLPEVEYAEPDFIHKTYGVPNDTYYSYQWHMSQLNMPEAWDIATGSGVIVAVIDTGVAYRAGSASGVAPDLAQTSFVAGYDFINNDPYADDDGSHGTHVAGTIAQSTNNNLGTTGMAYNATIMPVKVLSDEGSGSASTIAQGITFAADNGAQVINMSLGADSPSLTIEEACEYAYNKGVVIVCAAGNSGAGSVGYPAGFDQYCIAVGATQYDKTKSPYSQYGSSLDVVAPGGNTSVDQDGDGYNDGVLQQTIKGYDKNTGTTDYTFGYYFYQGTSMASPHAAGLAALLLSAKPNATVAEVRAAMENTAEDLGSAGWDNYFGNGLINPVAALQAIIGGGDDIEAPTTPDNFSGNPASTSSIALSWTASSDNVGVAGYRVYRNGAQVGNVSTPGYTDTGLAAGTYSYAVEAYDAAGNTSPRTPEISVTLSTIPDTQAPSVPTGLSATGSTDSVSLTWNGSTDNVGVAGYRILRDGVEVTTVSGTSYTDSGLSKGTYRYTVQAYDAAGNTSSESEYSDATVTGGSSTTDWAAWVTYAIGDTVTWQGVSYTCRIAHMSLPGWEPNVVPALWQRN